MGILEKLKIKRRLQKFLNYNYYPRLGEKMIWDLSYKFIEYWDRKMSIIDLYYECLAVGFKGDSFFSMFRGFLRDEDMSVLHKLTFGEGIK